MTADELFQLACDRARDTFRAFGSHMPIFLLDCGDEEGLQVVGVRFSDEVEKRAAVSAIREACELLCVQRLAFVVEAWFTSHPAGTDLSKITLPSQSPDREEIVWIVVETKALGERDRVGVMKIVRNKGRPHLAPIEEMPSETLGGLFSSMLGRKGLLQ